MRPLSLRSTGVGAPQVKGSRSGAGTHLPARAPLPELGYDARTRSRCDLSVADLRSASAALYSWAGRLDALIHEPAPDLEDTIDRLPIDLQPAATCGALGLPAA